MEEGSIKIIFDFEGTPMDNDNFEELQKIVLNTILNDSYILAKIKSDIKISYFTKFSYKLIYKSILFYYNKYSKLPTITELTLVIKDLLTDDLCSIEEILKDLKEIYELPISSLEFITDQVTRFIKRKRIEDTLRDVLPKIKEGDTSSIDILGERLAEDVDLNLHNNKAFRISDTKLLEDVRRESVGLDSNPTIIKSLIDSVNSSLLYKGYKSGDVVIVVAKPGCFTGDTRVVMEDNTTVTLKELSEQKKDKKILGYSLNSKKHIASDYALATKTTEVKELCFVYFKDIPEPVKCTKDHLFLTTDLEYVRAEDLWLHNNKKIISNNEKGFIEVSRVDIHEYLEPIEVYDIYKADYKNFVISVDGGIGVSVHNCGKTMFMVNELAYAARQGYNALHLFIGDMTEYDGLVRYLSNVSGVEQDFIANMTLEEQQNAVRNINLESKVLDNITVKSYAASEITVDQMIEDVFKIQSDMKTHYDIIAVDYPDNLIKDKESMYESGGDIYNRLSFLARRNHCVVLAGSQPKISCWNDEIIPLSGCAESSKKQHIADLIIALGRPSNDSALLTGFLAKVRRGTMGTIFRLKTEFNRARFQTISEFEYIQLKNEKRNNE